MSARLQSARPPVLRLVPLVAVTILAAGACGVSEPQDAQYAGICVDPTTNLRVDDDRCGDYDDEGSTGGGFFYMWMATSGANDHEPRYVPAVGRSVPADAGVRKVPAGTPLTRGVPAAGGSMPSLVRGGLGVKSGTSGGIGGRAGTSGGS